MCGRFALLAPAGELEQVFDVADVVQTVPRFNIAPTQPVAGIRVNPGNKRRELTYFYWGLIPSWSRDAKRASRMINARSETAAEKPSFRSPFKRRRCIIPANGFYEWQKRDGGKQPLYIHHSEGALLALAGLWEHWHSPDGSEIESCTILTTAPNEYMAPIHNRMPVLLDGADFDDWLYTPEREVGRLKHLLRPAPAGMLRAYPVSTYVNSPRNEGAGCIAAI